MRFKLKETAVDPLSRTPVADYLKTLGIRDVDSFINMPREEDEESYKMLSNLTPGLEMLHKHIEAGSSIFLQVD